MNILDITGAIGGFLATIGYIKFSLWAWPISLITILGNTFLYYQKGIYGDVGLHFVYFILTCYGWYQWKFGGSRKLNKLESPISYLNIKQGIILTLVAVVGFYIIFYILTNYTDSQIPILDAIATILSLIAQWMVGRKIIENWFLWLAIDSMYFTIHCHKDLPAHAVLKLIYLGMGIIGYWRWRKKVTHT